MTVARNTTIGMGDIKPADGSSADDQKLYPVDAIAAAKIRVPLVPSDLMMRPQLNLRLNRDSARCSVGLVVAPAGFGKTSLVAHWASRSKNPVAWLSLNPEDGEIDRFWVYLTDAVRAVLCGNETRFLPEDLGRQDLVDPARAIRYVDRFISHIESSSQQIVLVLDDYHMLPDDSPMQRTFSYLIANIPTNLHLILISRNMPHINLSKLRLSDRLFEIGEDDLRFSRSEIDNYLTSKGMTLSQKDLSDIQEASSGWPVALKLATLSDEGPTRLARGIEGVTTGYLFEEVVDRIPPAFEQVVIATACVDEFCPSLAACLVELESTGGEQSALHLVQDAIAYLMRNNLFITEVALAGKEPWYHYHALFLNALRLRMSRRGLEPVRRARQAASGWYREHGLLDMACSMAAEAEEWDAIRDIIMGNFKATFSEDDLPHLLRWYRLLPEDYIVRYPRLCLYEALPLATAGEFSKADDRIMSVLGSLKDNQDLMFATLAAVRSLVRSVEGKTNDAIAAAQMALKYLPVSERHMRLMVYQVLGGSYQLVDPARSREVFMDALRLDGVDSDRLAESSIYSNLCIIMAVLGDYSGVSKYSEAAKSLYPDGEWHRQPMLVYVMESEAMITFMRGDIHAAEKMCDDIDKVANLNWNPNGISSIYAMMSQASFAGGALDRAREMLHASLGTSLLGFARTYPSLPFLKSFVEDESIVDTWNGSLNNPPSDKGAAPIRWLHCAIRLVCSATGGSSHLYPDIDDDSQLLDDIQSLSQGVDDAQVLDRALIELLLACAREISGYGDEAEAALCEAIETLAPEAIWQPIYGNAAMLGPILARLAKKDRDSIPAKLYRKLPAFSSLSLKGRGEEADQLLSSRELDVMRLAATGMSTNEIASYLFISRETAKKHLANTFTKLGVHGRLQAIAVLKERGLL